MNLKQKIDLLIELYDLLSNHFKHNDILINHWFHNKRLGEVGEYTPYTLSLNEDGLQKLLDYIHKDGF